MSFRDDFASEGWPVLAAELGRTVTYAPFGGAAAEITAVWQPEQVTADWQEDGRQDAAAGVLKVGAGDVPRPDLRDVVTIDGVAWAVKAINRRGPVVEMQLEAREQRRLGGGERVLRR